MDRRCIVVAGGPWEDCGRVELQARADDYIVACDAGYANALRLGLRPALAVGDFDSYRGEVAPEIPVYTVPARKDDTDTMLGVKLGMEEGCREFVILCGFGGRLDHTVANLQTLCFLCEQGLQGSMLSERNCAWAVRNGTLRLPRMEGYHLSVFAAGGRCEGITLRGLEYPLENGTLTPATPLGVSNEFVAEQAQICVRSGTLLVIASRDAG